MQADQRRRRSLSTFVRLFAGRRRPPQALSAQRERLATSAEVMALRLGR
ncbi:hypothetical protein [Gordonia zhaorongruii]|nr:hypothetical protein [Gordonia zhaorongruii]